MSPNQKSKISQDTDDTISKCLFPHMKLPYYNYLNYEKSSNDWPNES